MSEAILYSLTQLTALRGIYSNDRGYNCPTYWMLKPGWVLNVVQHLWGTDPKGLNVTSKTSNGYISLRGTTFQVTTYYYYDLATKYSMAAN